MSASQHAGRPTETEPLLSFGQERLWLLEQFEPDSLAYNRPCHIRLVGALDLDALRESLTQIISRHEALRYRFSDAGGVPVVKIDIAHPVELDVVSLEHVPRVRRGQEAERLALEHSRRPFSLAAGPLVRCQLLRLDWTEHILLITLHHIVFDDWSQGVLHRELCALYNAATTGSDCPLVDLHVQYADFVSWQRQQLEGEALAEHAGYWKRQLQSGQFVMPLPTDRPRPPRQTYHGGTHRFDMPTGVTHRLRGFAQERKATLFMVLLAAFDVLLYRYTGEADIMVGTPIFGRTRVEHEDLIGLFINTLVLRTDVSGAPSFEELLIQVRQRSLEAFAHQILPFERLVTLLEVPRDVSRPPVFQTFFHVRNVHRPKLNFEGLEAEPYAIDLGIARFDLTLEFESHSPDDLRGRLIYNTDLFDSSTIARMSRHFLTLLDGALAQPAMPVAQLPILTTDERREFDEWNDTEVDTSSDRAVHTQVAACAAHAPDCVAVEGDGGVLTYSELDSRAETLANRLRARGVRRGTTVGICLERSPSMVVGLLGILKAGAAYLPLDPEFPATRLQLMLEDSQVSLVVSENDSRARIPEFSAEVIGLDDQLTGPVAVPVTDRDVDVDAGDDPADLNALAYVIYTSGSTGRPKGVEVTHQSLANLLEGIGSHLKLGPSDGWLAVTSLSFDIHALELLLPLTVGARVVVATLDEVRDGRSLLDLLHRSQATVMQATPTLWSMLAELDWPEMSKLQAISGGEALSRPLADRLCARVGTLYNMYGPTETTVWSTVEKVTPDGETPVSIGRPIRNTQVYLLDEYQKDVPAGVTGEIYIGGAGLAVGYRNQSELTRERFVYVLCEDGQRRRLYRTGDLGHWRADGTLMFLGRRDHQVKLRGFRIELAEIERALDRHRGVQTSVAMVWDADNGAQRLVAYILPASDSRDESERTLENATTQVSEWGEVWQETFEQAQAVTDSTLNTAGVNSSYTLRPIPELETREWVEHAAARIRALEPQRVLEMGCGLGRILSRVAPMCTEYWGLDPSQAALDYVRRNLGSLADSETSIHLRRQFADDWREIPERHFDVVVLNGVVMYFPGADYLRDVLDGALRATREGASLYLGDLRNLSLLEAFHLSVELYQADDDQPFGQLLQRIQRRVKEEEELLVDPALFSELSTRYPRIGEVQVLLKRGRYQNEMTRFRYDVVLSLDRQAHDHGGGECWTWGGQTIPGGIEAYLRADGDSSLRVQGVPNRRVLPEVELLSQRGEHDARTCAEVRALLEASRGRMIAPEDFSAIGERHGYATVVNPSASQGSGYFDVLFHRRHSTVLARQTSPRSSEALIADVDPIADIDWSRHTNDPLVRKRELELTRSLRRDLEQHLPPYMVPSDFVLLDALPHTPNGKVDRRALSRPDVERRDAQAQSATPRTDVERIIVEVCNQVLGRRDVGIYDNFFDLGGHSLLLMQAVARLDDELDVRVAVRQFADQTISQLAVLYENTLKERSSPRPQRPSDPANDPPPA